VNTHTILILGATNRNGLAAAGALINQNYRLIGTDLLARSRLARIFQYSSKPKVFDEIVYYKVSPNKDEEAFIHQLERMIQDMKIDVLLATGTENTLLLAKHKERLLKLCKVPVENFEKMESIHDKYQAMKLCESIGVPIPETILIEGEQHISDIKEGLRYPMVFKARLGASNEGVTVVQNSIELELAFSDYHHQFSSKSAFSEGWEKPILQEYIPGELHDVTSYSEDGKPLALLSQKRLMTSPLWGGSGIVNVTTNDERIKAYAAQIIESVSWDGILEFDFKIDSRSGEPRLIEMNPKIWGTTWLTISAGYLMPLYLVKNALGEKVDIPDNYTIGLKARWPLLELKTWSEKPLSLKKVLGRVWMFIWLFFEKGVVYDTRLSGVKSILISLVAVFLLGIYNLIAKSFRGRSQD
jgi:predicted ATP-grasp superfamily ATP-dependent carboligase